MTAVYFYLDRSPFLHYGDPVTPRRWTRRGGILVRMEGNMAPELWKILSSTWEKGYRVFNLRTDRARSPRTGEAYDFFVIESSDWVNVIPLTPDNRVVLIEQYRHGTREITLEIPGGLINDHDTPAAAASRELREETGYREEDLIPLGWVHPNPAIQGNRCYTFVAKNVVLEGSQMLDEKEDIEVVLYPLREIPGLIRVGAIKHSLVIAAFYRFYMEYLPLEVWESEEVPKSGSPSR